MSVASYLKKHCEALVKDVGIEALGGAKPTGVEWNAPAVAHGDIVARCGGDFVDEVDVTIQSDTIGAGDDIKVQRHDGMEFQRV